MILASAVTTTPLGAGGASAKPVEPASASLAKADAAAATAKPKAGDAKSRRRLAAAKVAVEAKAERATPPTEPGGRPRRAQVRPGNTRRWPRRARPMDDAAAIDDGSQSDARAVQACWLRVIAVAAAGWAVRAPGP